MNEPKKPQIYRDIIDALVRDCQQGQGQIGAKRARTGIWNKNATPTYIPEQHKINLMLERMSATDRETLAALLTQQFEGGVFETLKILEQFQIEPFKDGYEGTPYHDFIGRLAKWNWPEA